MKHSLLTKIIPVFLLTATIATAEDRKPSGFARIDHDDLGFSVWGLVNHPVTKELDITSLAILNNSIAEVDAGITIYLDQFTFIPMVGARVDWNQRRFVGLGAPQLYSFYNSDDFYIELWTMLWINSPFDGGDDAFYHRGFVLWKPSKFVGFGPHDEGTATSAGVISNRVGGTINLFAPPATLGLFGGWETINSARVDGKGLVGRVTCIYSW